MSYLVYDLETGILPFHGRKASSFNPENWVVARGWKFKGDTQNSWTYHPTHDRTTYLKIPKHVKMLVGFNLKFDLLWEMNQGNPDLLPFFKRGGTIWDCQYAEYLIMAQQDGAQMASLDSCAPKYGAKVKIDEVKLMWENGINTPDIPEDLLIDYLVGTEAEGRHGGDIRNTELVFLGQVAKAQEQGQLKMIQDRMDGLLATTEMEFNGLKVDVEEAARRLNVLNAELNELDTELSTHLPPDLPFEFNWGSWQQKSAIIFGGTIGYKARSEYDNEDGTPARLKAFQQWPMKDGEAVDPETSYFTEDEYDKYLSGKKKGEIKLVKVEVEGPRKTKIMDFLYTFPRITEPKPQWKTDTTDKNDRPFYSTGADVIEELSLRNIPFLKALGRRQKLDKEVGVYYLRIHPKKGPSGMLTTVQASDKILHHNLNHTITVTTRLSSSEPNLQNIPRPPSEAKKMFVSRFGADGLMMEADYSQLEVVVQGVLSGDKALCEDLRSKIDFHCKRLAAKYGMSYQDAINWAKDDTHPDYTKEGKKARQGCKEFSFQRAYGAGAPAIAYQTGMTVEEVEALIEAEERMYPGVTMFNSIVEKAVKTSTVPFQRADENGNWKSYRTGFWRAPTGTIYSFQSKDAPEWLKKKGIQDSFMPTELKNYPVQGTGGEIVQAMIGRLWRALIATDFMGGRVFLVNTVHDCVWLDCHKDVVNEVAKLVKSVMESVPEFYNARHGMKIEVPFPVEVEVGPNMFDLDHWKDAA